MARTNGYLKRWYFDIGRASSPAALLAEIETPGSRASSYGKPGPNWRPRRPIIGSPATTADRWKSLLESDSVSHQRDRGEGRETWRRKRRRKLRPARTSNVWKRCNPGNGSTRPSMASHGAQCGPWLPDQRRQQRSGKELFHIAAIREMRVYVQVPQASRARRGPEPRRSWPLPSCPAAASGEASPRTSNANRSGFAHSDD